MTKEQVDLIIKENIELKKENAQLREAIERMNDQIEKLTQSVNYLTDKLYGRKSEKTKVLFDGEQISFLFDEAEKNADPKEKEPEVEEITYTRNKKAAGKKETDLKDLAHQKIVHVLDESELICDKCGSIMRPIGETFIRSEVVFLPAQLFIKDHYQMSYECLSCRKTEEKAQIKKADVPAPLMKHSFASPSSVSYVIHQKFVNAVPLYRQEKDWEALGIPLSRATMSNWLITCARDYLIPIRNRMAQTLKQQPVIHADETPVQVLHEPGRKDTTESYMWVYTSGYDSDMPIRIYDYRPGRGGKYPKAFLRGFKGILQTDGYAGYDQIPDVIRCFCWAHCRRKFKDALPAEKDLRKDSIAAKAIAYCSRLFKIEEEILKLDPDERVKARHEKEQPLIDEFFKWLGSCTQNILPKSKTGEAINYVLKHRTEFTNYMDNGKAVLSNNIAERAVRPFTIGRKNWLFSGSPRGAEASAAIYSMVETAKANELDPYLYLTFLFTELPGLDIKHHPDILDDFMPWDEEIKQLCRKGNARKGADIYSENLNSIIDNNESSK